MAVYSTTVRQDLPRQIWRGLTFSIRQLLAVMAFIALACVALARANDWWVSATFGLAVAALTVGILLAVYRAGPRRAFWIGFCLCGWVYMALMLYSWHLRNSKEMNSGHPLRNPNTALVTSRLTSLAYDRLFSRKAVNVTLGSTGGYGMSSPGDASYGSAAGGSADGGYGGMPGISGSAGGMPGATGMMTGSADGVAMAGGYGGYGGYGGGFGAPGGYAVQPAAAALALTLPSQTHFMNVGHSLWAILIACLGGWIGRLAFATGQQPAAAPPIGGGAE